MSLSTMSNARRGLWLGVSLAVGAGLVYVACTRCESEMRTEIGAFHSKDDGIRAAIKQLAAEIRRCPEAETYRVIWASPEQASDQAVLYQRRHKGIGYERDIYSSFAEKPYIVDDEDIQKVAEKGGSLEAFAEFDQRKGSSK